MRVTRVDSEFEREPLVRPFGFKGGYMLEIWQSAVLLESGSGARAIGLGTHNVLWSDQDVFAAHTESGGNALMYAVTERALKMVKETPFTSPVELLDEIQEDLYHYARRITEHPALRKTFVLNALVPVDNAAWILYARENGLDTLDELIPDAYRAGLAHRHTEVASVPSIAYTIPVEEMRSAVEDGYFVMKIKMGQPGTQEEMLEKDKQRLSAIHSAIGDHDTDRTESGRLPYYFDANGRYEDKETLLRLLDHAEAIGALDQIAVFEEPFPEAYEVDVGDVPVPLAADESAHTDRDAAARIDMGYGLIALKPVAKTLSMTMKIARVAHQRNVPCFCADLTVNPILVDWNKSVAARLAPLPGFSMGLLETNGHQNYLHWDRMKSYHPRAGASWTEARNGVFELDETFYHESGGILDSSPHYERVFERG